MWSYNYSDYLCHYGVSGQKRGVRRYQNEDGTLTPEGREHYGVGEERQPSNGVAEQQRQRFTNGARSRVSIAKNSKFLGQKAQPMSDKEKTDKKAQARKIIAIAGGIALASIGIAAVARYRSKVTQNLIQLAKNHVHDRYTKFGDGSASSEYWKRMDSSKITSRRKALRELGIKGHKSAKAFIKENRIAKMKTHEIIEKRTGPLVEGYHRSIFGKMKSVPLRKMTRMRKRLARQYYE